MNKYYGPLQSKGQADAWAAQLRKSGTPQATGAASMLAFNWHYVAARPALARKVEELVNAARQI